VNSLHALVIRAAVCPEAPSAQAAQFGDDVLGWVKWGVLVIMGISFFASTGMLVWGRVTHHPRGARLGFDGLMIVLLGAMLYVTGYGIVTTIVGSGC
jgi:amino acid transporter